MKLLKNLSPAANFKMVQFFRKAFFLTLFFCGLLTANAQNPENSGNAQPKSGEKVKFVLKPNSREEKVVIVDNKLKRIHKERNKAIVQKLHQKRQKRMMLMKNDKNRRQEMMQRRKLMMQKRNNVRR